jgi:hypothetical protein
MPTGKNWFNFLYINLGFALYFLTIFYFTSVQQIKANWPKYRCNPMFMLLADNVDQNFVYCIQNMQKGLMGYILQPLNFITNNLSSLSGNFMNEINSIRNMFNTSRNFVTNITQSIFGVFLNLVIEFQKIIIGIRDLVGKLVGILTTFMYLLSGSLSTMQSAWGGPPGQLVRALGSCFHPETIILLKNGEKVQMKNLNLGDILENGSRVNAVMKIENYENQDMYLLKGKGVDGLDIYVTGSHLIYDNFKSKYIEVKDYKDVVIQNNKKINWFSCVITSDHIISIGSCKFWDWEDYIHKIK